MSRGVWWSKVSKRGGRRRCDVLLSNLRAPRFWPSDVVCGGGATGRVSRPGRRGTSSTAAPPLLSSGLASGSKSCTAPTRSSLLQSMRSWPVRVIDHSAPRQAWQGRNGCLSGLHSRSHLISSDLDSFAAPKSSQSRSRPGLVPDRPLMRA